MSRALDIRAWWHPDLTTPCRETDPDMWFPGIGPWQGAHRAQEMCLACPVIAECLAYANAIKPTHGIWGGVNFGRIAREKRAAL